MKRGNMRYTSHHVARNYCEEFEYDPDDEDAKSAAYEAAIQDARARLPEVGHLEKVEVHNHYGDVLYRVSVEIPRGRGRRTRLPA